MTHRLLQRERRVHEHIRRYRVEESLRGLSPLDFAQFAAAMPKIAAVAVAVGRTLPLPSAPA